MARSKKLMASDGLDEMRAVMAKALKITGVGQPLGEREWEPAELIGTGSLGADWVCRGGFPRGRITEVYGPQQSSKSTLCLSVAAQVQRSGGRVAWIDMEYAFDAEWATRVGVSVDTLYLEQPRTGEDALTFADIALKHDAFDLIVIDSVAGLVPRAELEGDMGDSNVGLHARLMSQACRKLAGEASRARTSIVFINQLRDKIGVMFGSPETTTGGKALPFWASLRLDVRKTQLIKDGDTAVGNLIKITNKKSRHGGFLRSLEVPLNWELGFDQATEAFELSKARGLLQAKGAHYSLGDVSLGNGRARVIETLREQPELLAQLQTAVREALK